MSQSSQANVAVIESSCRTKKARTTGSVTPLPPLQEPDRQVHDRPVAFAQLLAELKASSFTGVLEVNHQKFTTFLHFNGGNPICVELGDPSLALGRMLLNRGTITRQDYQAAVTLMTDCVVDNENVRLGECLIKLRILSPAQVYEALSDQAVEKVLACFNDPGAEFSISSKDDIPARVPFAADLKTEWLILTGFKRHVSTDRLRACLEEVWELYPCLDDPAQVAVLFGLAGAERRFLNRINGRTTVKSLCQEAGPLSQQDTLALCAALQVTKLAEHLALPLVQNVSGSYARVSPSKKNAKPKQVEDRVNTEISKTTADAALEFEKASLQVLSRITTRKRPAIARKSSRSQLKENPKPSVSAPVSRALASLASAPDWVKSLVRTSKPDTPATKPSAKAERSFKQGKQLLRHGHCQEASRHFQQALDQDGENLRYQLYGAWSAYQMAKKREQTFLYKGISRELCLELLQQQTDDALVHLALGHFLRCEGEYDAARKHLRKAAAIDPADVAIQRELRLLGSN